MRLNWHIVKGITGGSFAVSILNVFVMKMPPILWALFVVSGSLFLVSSYKIWRKK